MSVDLIGENNQVILEFMITFAFMFALGGSFPIMLALCNLVIPSVAVSCHKLKGQKECKKMI